MASSAANGDAPTFGDLVEQWADSHFDNWEFHDAQWYDFQTPRGTPVEVKGTQQWVSNGHGPNGNPQRCRGRFKLWSKDHERLKQNDGVYLAVLYEDTEDGINVLEWKILDPSSIEDATGTEWYEVTTNPRAQSKGDVCRVRWSYLIDPEEVS